jgi:aminotransferase
VKYYSKYDVHYDPSQVYVTPGGTAALYLANITCLKPGDEALTFDPSFQRYYAGLPSLGVDVVPVPLTEPGYHLNPEELKTRITDKSKMLILCNPNNPTGTVFTKEELKSVADLAIDHDLIVVSDEFYSEFVYDQRKHIAISSIEGMKDRTFVVIGATKMFSFTGWRLASLILPEEHYQKMLQGASNLGLRPATFVQVAAAGFNAMREPLGKGVMKEWRNEFDNRRRVFCQRMDEIDGISCHTFEGAFYAYPDVSSFGIPVNKFVDELKTKAKVQVGNGERHGGVRILGKESIAYGHIRPALVQDVDLLEEAADRIEHYTKSL